MEFTCCLCCRAQLLGTAVPQSISSSSLNPLSRKDRVWHEDHELNANDLAEAKEHFSQATDYARQKASLSYWKRTPLGYEGEEAVSTKYYPEGMIEAGKKGADGLTTCCA